MARFRRLEVVNLTALPMVPLDEPLGVSLMAQNAIKDAMRKNLKDNVPSCLVGSIQQVNQVIADADLSPNPLVHSLKRAKENHSIFARAQNSGMSNLSLSKGKQQIKISWQSCTSTHPLTTLGQTIFQMGWTSVTWWAT